MTWTVYLTFKNADMTEGRGPMLPDECFLHKVHADAYIDAQPGCMGRMQKWSEQEYGDWYVREIHVHSGPMDPAEIQRQKAIKRARAKLTVAELKLLGLD